MRTSLALLAAVAVALGPAAAASAKEIASVKVCGADGCHDVTDRATHAVVDGGPPTMPPDKPAPFYRIKVKIKAEGNESIPGWTNLWVPAPELLQGDDGTWMTPASTTVDALKALTRGIEPLPATKLALPAPVVAPPPTGAAVPATPPDDGGTPPGVWVFLAAGALGLAYAVARGATALVARRRGAEPAG